MYRSPTRTGRSSTFSVTVPATKPTKGNKPATNLLRWFLSCGRRNGCSVILNQVESKLVVVREALSGMLQLAVESRYLVTNPCRGVDLPRHPHREMRFLNPDEIERLSRAVTGRYRTLVLLLAYGGLRWGEAAGLKVARCDLLPSRIEVAETLIELDGGFGFGEPKTYHRLRAGIPEVRWHRRTRPGQLRWSTVGPPI